MDANREGRLKGGGSGPVGRGGIHVFWLAVFWGVSCPLPMEGAEAAYRIGVIRDDVSWYFDSMVSNFMEELRPLARGNYEISVDERFNAEGDFSVIPELIREAMADPQIDLIYTGGIVATEFVANLSPAQRIKPVIGGALQMVDLAWMPISEEGTSEVPNYTFITNPQRVRADLELLKRLVEPDVVHIMIDEPIIEHLSILERGIEFF